MKEIKKAPSLVGQRFILKFYLISVYIQLSKQLSAVHDLHKQAKMRKVKKYLKSANKYSPKNNIIGIRESENYRSGSRNRYPQKELLLYKMMIRSKKNKLEKKKPENTDLK